MKYINPGIAELLDVDGGTTIESSLYNPTATLNGKQLFSVTGYNPWFNDSDEYECKQLVVHSTSNQMPLSNIILSDAPFDLRERITAVPLGNPVTDMIDRGDGSYMAEAAGQQILSTVDVSSLISAYGGLSQVTGIAVAGNPAYRTAEGLTSLIDISKSDDVQTEHGSKTLRTSTTAGVLHCHTVNMTIAEMAGMQLGWKAGV